jgi:tRNA threonylcarbamoyladenosine biosynthesis protein TsaE
MLRFKTASPAESLALGNCLGKLLRPGEVICLTGDLGAGKTLLVQGIAAAVKIPSPITSPTFTIVNVYEGTYTLYHFDLYRLEHPEELVDIGYYEYLNGDGIVVIEWPDKFPEELPKRHLWIEICRGKEADERCFLVTAHGDDYDRICEELKKKCPFLV